MSRQWKLKKIFQHWHIVALLLALYDVVAVNMAYFMALWFRFDCSFSEMLTDGADYLTIFLQFIPIYSVLCVTTFFLMRLYHSIWRFASINELSRVAGGTAITALFQIVGTVLLANLGQLDSGISRMPILYYVFGTCLQFLLLLGIRFSYRLVLLLRSTRRGDSAVAQRVMIIGAGNAGQMILHDAAQLAKQNLKVCCLIDDNRNKWNRHVEGIPVVGGRYDILRNVEKFNIDKIFVAIPSASVKDKREILNICKESGCELKDLPGIGELVNGQISISDMKDVAVEDLLGRETIQVNMEEIYRFITDKTILVTGGGGSIGSELCRQVADHKPRQLIIFDIYENNAYEIEQELRREHPDLNLRVLIGSVRDSRCLDNVFAAYKPDVVYHAAAHKHVPLMETSPCEAIKNNVIGTYKTAYAAMLHGCKRFVLISTDKAVNPTNIMGASKRLCEMVVQSFDKAIKEGNADSLPRLFTHHEETYQTHAAVKNACTEYVAVRFGNVLGSNGSVIPLFKKQIAKGGPVTVTHPDIIRYFMTIPEAVALVMQAGTYARGGEIFVLDMGAPVKIDELARNLIKLSGLRPDVDIPVVYTGLRPGEKLYEEKLMAEEGLQKTANELIHIGNPVPFDMEDFLLRLRRLMDAAYENDEAICDAVADMVPTYQRQNAARKDATYEALRKEIMETVGI